MNKLKKFNKIKKYIDKNNSFLNITMETLNAKKTLFNKTLAATILTAISAYAIFFMTKLWMSSESEGFQMLYGLLVMLFFFITVFWGAMVNETYTALRKMTVKTNEGCLSTIKEMEDFCKEIKSSVELLECLENEIKTKDFINQILKKSDQLSTEEIKTLNDIIEDDNKQRSMLRNSVESSLVFEIAND